MKMRNGARGPDPERLFSYLEVPIGSVIYGADSPVRLTGQWRYTRPAMLEKIPPCQAGCPLGTPIRAVIERLKQGEYEEALRLVKEENPFPGICGRVCYHACEARCLRGELDEPTNIHALERFLSDRASPPNGYEARRPEAISKNKEVAVVGGGPAGLSCAYFLRGMGHRVTLYEAMPSLGGMLRFGIPPYRLPREILDREIEAVLARGVHVVAPALVGRDIPWESMQNYDAVFLAIGNHKGICLHRPAEEAEGILSGIDFLRTVHIGDSVSLGERVAVIGGGNTAIDVARVVSRMGSRPTLLYRRDRREMPAFEDEIREAEEEGIPMRFLTLPVKVHVEQGKVKGIECVRTLLQPDGNGRSRVVPVPGSDFMLDADALIFATGQEIDPAHLPEGWKIVEGKIPVTPSLSIGEPGFFAGGDMVSHQKTVVDAIASGKKAALCMDLFLQGKHPEDWIDSFRVCENGPISMRAYLDASVQAHPKVVSFQEMNPVYSSAQERSVMPTLSLDRRNSLLSEVNLGLDERMALEAADRCLHCGSCTLCDNCYLFCPDGVVQRDSTGMRNVIDYDYCKGCGICHNECPTGAIDMEVESEE